MADNLWDDQGEPFNDMPDEAQTGHDGKPIPVNQETVYSPPSRAPIQRQQAPQQEEYHETQEDYSDLLPSLGLEDVADEEDLADVLNDAHLRLEQGNLWRVIINHDLFAGSDADARAIQNVQSEIRKFARERMEVMLGMKRDGAEVERLEIDFPFNALEVDILKKLASAATKGKSEYSDNYVPEVRRIREEIPVIHKKAALNTIGSMSSTKKPIRPAPVVPKRPLPSRASSPVKRSKLDMTIDQICREEGVPRELLEEHLKPLKKAAHELTGQEIQDRNREVSQRRATQVSSSNALPMPTQEQINSMAEGHANKIASGKIGPGVDTARLIDAVKRMPITKP